MSLKGHKMLWEHRLREHVRDFLLNCSRWLFLNVIFAVRQVTRRRCYTRKSVRNLPCNGLELRNVVGRIAPCKGALSLDHFFSWNLSRNFVATQVARIVCQVQNATKWICLTFFCCCCRNLQRWLQQKRCKTCLFLGIFALRIDPCNLCCNEIARQVAKKIARCNSALTVT